ncbi:MAG: hypothetical protein AAGI30_03860 [Planctomycetota bacterium]
MSHATAPESRPGTSENPRIVLDVLTGLWREASRPLLWTAGVFAAMAPLSAALVVIDPRVLDGANVWLKPLKFQLSVSIFLATLAFMMPLAAPSFRRGVLGKSTVAIALATSTFEIAWITFRAAIGERSHYATDTAFGGTMYALMGIAAVLLSLTPVAVATSAMLTTDVRRSTQILRWGIVLGSVVGLVGASGIGFLLGGSPDHYPTDPQDAEHRLPVAGWSVERGDLRIAHFVGLHAMQGLFVASLFLLRLPPRWAKAVLVVGAIGWLAAVLWLTALALDNTSPFAIPPMLDPGHSEAAA